MKNEIKKDFNLLTFLIFFVGWIDIKWNLSSNYNTYYIKNTIVILLGVFTVIAMLIIILFTSLTGLLWGAKFLLLGVLSASAYSFSAFYAAETFKPNSQAYRESSTRIKNLMCELKDGGNSVSFRPIMESYKIYLNENDK